VMEEFIAAMRAAADAPEYDDDDAERGVADTYPSVC